MPEVIPGPIDGDHSYKRADLALNSINQDLQKVKPWEQEDDSDKPFERGQRIQTTSDRLIFSFHYRNKIDSCNEILK